MVMQKVPATSPSANHQGWWYSACTANAVSANAASVTSSDHSRPRQLSSVSAIAQAMVPSSSGMMWSISSSTQQPAMRLASAMKTRRL